MGAKTPTLQWLKTVFADDNKAATLTRLSSGKVFGDGSHSIPSLRMLGYALFKEALRPSKR